MVARTNIQMARSRSRVGDIGKSTPKLRAESRKGRAEKIRKEAKRKSDLILIEKLRLIKDKTIRDVDITSRRIFGKPITESRKRALIEIISQAASSEDVKIKVKKRKGN